MEKLIKNCNLVPKISLLEPGWRNCSFDVAQKKVMELQIKGLQVCSDTHTLQVCDHQCIVVIRQI